MLIVVVKGNIEKSLKELKGKVIKTKQTKKLLELKEFDKKMLIKMTLENSPAWTGAEYINGKFAEKETING